MNTKRTYYGYSTYQQRKLLFEIWEKTGAVTQACQKAHVSRRLFYYWKSRFDEKGYAGLEKFDSRAAHHPNKKDERIEQKVLDLIELVLSFEVQNWQPLLYIFRPLSQPSNLLPGLIRSRHIFAFHFIFLWRVRIPKRKVYALNFLALHHVACLLQLFIIGIDVEAKPLNKHFSK